MIIELFKGELCPYIHSVKTPLKYLLLSLVLMLSVAAHAQAPASANDCKQYLIDTLVGKSAQRQVYPKDVVMLYDDNGPYMTIFPIKTSGEKMIVNMHLIDNAVGCIEQSAKINVQFTDSTQEDFYSDSRPNCEGDVIVYFGVRSNMDKVYEDLHTKPLKLIRINTAKGFAAKEIDHTNAVLLNNQLRCISEKKW